MTLTQDLINKHKAKNKVTKKIDTELRKTFAKVEYLDDFRTFLVWMENGKTYALRLSDLPEADLTAVSKWALSKDRGYIEILQKSGNKFDIPWDDVLYHCEPQYEFYKGKRLQAETDVRLIGERLRQLRESKGYSIQTLADKTNIKRPNLSRIENGHHQPSLATLEKIASGLRVSVAELVVKTDLPHSGQR